MTAYRPAGHAGRCCLCGLSHVLPGTPVATMPRSWRPGHPERTAHKDCHRALVEAVRARAERLARAARAPDEAGTP